MEPTRRQLAQKASLTEADLAEVARCRRAYNQLGFGYQVGFVRLHNRFPKQEPLELIDELVLFTGVQLGIDSNLIADYQSRRQTVSEHQQRIAEYLGLRRFDEGARVALEVFLFEEALRLEQAPALKKRAEDFLAEEKILRPADSTIARVIGEQRQRARDHIFETVASTISSEMAGKLDELLVVPAEASVSPLQEIKANPGNPAVKSMKVALRKVSLIEETGVLELDMSWLNSNYQRALFHKVRKSSAYRLRELKEPVRRAALACFLWQSYGDAVDEAVIMFTRLLTRMETKASDALDETMVKERKAIRSGLEALAVLGPLILDKSASKAGLRKRLLTAIPEEDLAERVRHAAEWVSGRKRDHLPLIVARYSTLRKYAPAFLDVVAFEPEGGREAVPALGAVTTLRKLNDTNKRKVPPDTDTEFLANRWREIVGSGKSINRPAWECAVLLKFRDEIRSGNVAVRHSKRFGHLGDFFIPEDQWSRVRDQFFARSRLPTAAEDVPAYFERRLADAFDRFLATAPTNAYAQVDEQGWRVSTDPADRLSDDDAEQLARLKAWLKKNMRHTLLPDLLIEVDNDLGFSRKFMPASRRADPDPEEVRTIIAAVMAHGCNLGTQTMARLTAGVTYDQLKRVGDWQLTRDTQRDALAVLVNAISGLDTSLYWGEGKTSASDGQRFRFRRKTLQQTYSPRFSDFALEFYSFIADNYAPFYSTPIECTDRDAATVLDGLLYNESDLELEEHYTDTHGYTEINFAAFEMLGRRFRPRIRDIKKQHIYRLDDRDYGAFASLVGRADRKINLRPIVQQWDRLGHFYASLECGHRTASVALRRLAGFSAKNRFYRANRDLGRLLKTEFILDYMSRPELRARIRRGLLKIEQMHALAREVFFGHRGEVNAREVWEQMNSCSCLTLIVACIIYWQAKEISRVIRQADPEGNGIEPSLLQHVSPIEWENVVVYGEYRLDRRRIRVGRRRSP